MLWTSTPARRLLFALACIIWVGLLGTGLTQLARYSSTPGPAATAAPAWPKPSSIDRDPTRYTLVLFLHPHCTCSRATIGELEKLAEKLGSRLAIRARVYHPAAEPASWARSSLWHALAAIPGAQVTEDPDGREARVFGAMVSGQAMLYLPDGRLAFSGGITYARGHAGDNAGIQAILSAVLAVSSTVSQTPVFGCFLYGSRARVEAPASGGPA